MNDQATLPPDTIPIDQKPGAVSAASPCSAPVTAVAPWFGSKRNLAREIVKTMGRHSAYWEPFCGSLAVLLAKGPVTMETVNDLHGDLINLCRVLKVPDTAIELYGRLDRVVMHEQLFHEAAQRYRQRGNIPAGESPDVDRAEDFMIASWCGRNGIAGTQSYNQGFCVRYTKNGGHAAKRWASAVDSIPEWHRRLRHVTVVNRNAFDLLERIEDADGVAIYVDPPYLEKGATYVHDFEAGQHECLAKVLRRFKRTRVVVSYYDHARLRELYDGWRRVEIEVTRSLVNQGLRDRCGGETVREVLLVNDRQATLW
jgi:DNA adenine methylase